MPWSVEMTGAAISRQSSVLCVFARGQAPCRKGPPCRTLPRLRCFASAQHDPGQSSVVVLRASERIRSEPPAVWLGANQPRFRANVLQVAVATSGPLVAFRFDKRAACGYNKRLTSAPAPAMFAVMGMSTQDETFAACRAPFAFNTSAGKDLWVSGTVVTPFARLIVCCATRPPRPRGPRGYVGLPWNSGDATSAERAAARDRSSLSKSFDPRSKA